MNILQKGINWKTTLIAIMIVSLASCTTFKRDDPSRVGIWYPYASMRVELTRDDIYKSFEVVNLGGGPIKIKAVGQMTWNSLVGQYSETALLEIRFSNNSVKRYYATTSFLQKHGRIEYTGYKTSKDYFWESGLGSFIKILVFISFIYLCYALIKSHIKSSEKNRKLIERF